MEIMENLNELVKISTEIITEKHFKTRMRHIPAFFYIKMYEKSLVYYGLAVYIKKCDLQKLGFQMVINVTNDFSEIFTQNRY
tara:strand:+ start:3494 stop:3739 length:246 start_codon:yes stop_codon:yes gene_type:complete